jgi:hypothetical protein
VRRPVRLWLLFFSTAIMGYVLGSWLMPETMGDATSLTHLSEQLKSLDEIAIRLSISTLLFFLIIPVAYWFWVIKATSQPKWRLLIILSLSCLVARYQYPSEIAQYFEFIAWLRYPFIAVLLALEFYLIFSVGRSLWQARKGAGDPRLNILAKYDEGTKERDIGLMLAYEPASWYYAIPRFSRNHTPSIGQLKLLSSTKIHFIPFLTVNLALAFISYLLLIDWSILAAVVLSTVFIWNTLPIIANYRSSKHHTIYVENGVLVVNNNWLGFMVIKLGAIDSAGKMSKGIGYKGLCLGRGTPNMIMRFSKDQTYYSFLAMFSDKVSEIALNVEDVENTIKALENQQRSYQQ